MSKNEDLKLNFHCCSETPFLLIPGSPASEHKNDETNDLLINNQHKKEKLNKIKMRQSLRIKQMIVLSRTLEDKTVIQLGKKTPLLTKVTV